MKLRLLPTFALLFALLASAASMAGSISVSPIRIDLSQAQRSVVLTVTNGGSQSAVIQAQMMSWAQPGDREDLAPTPDIVASPPIFTIAPGASQLVRIFLRRAPDPVAETSYRVILTEVPGAQEAGFTGARLSIKLSLPIFVAALGPTQPTLAWTGAHMADGRFALSVANSGNKHVQVQRIVVGDPAQPEALFAGLLYVLPGQQRTVVLSPTKGRAFPRDRVSLHAETDAGRVQSDVVVNRP
jgi:fimbrial chaperone protein